jgi:hypothetical protein
MWFPGSTNFVRTSSLYGSSHNSVKYTSMKGENQVVKGLNVGMRPPCHTASARRSLFAHPPLLT